MDKTCTKCKQCKPITEFGRHKQTKTGYRSRCKECNRKEARCFYADNPKPYKARAYAFRKKLSAYLNRVMNRIKARMGCGLCEEREVCCLDFHHIEKGIPLGKAANNGYASFERELRKCIILCANCHRKAHAGLYVVSRVPRWDGTIKRKSFK